MINLETNIEQLQTQLAFEKANYKLLAGKVEILIDAEIKYRQSKDQRLLNQLWNLEKELKQMVNPKPVKQAVMDWEAK